MIVLPCLVDTHALSRTEEWFPFLCGWGLALPRGRRMQRIPCPVYLIFREVSVQSICTISALEDISECLKIQQFSNQSIIWKINFTINDPKLESLTKLCCSWLFCSSFSLHNAPSLSVQQRGCFLLPLWECQENWAVLGCAITFLCAMIW